VLRRRQDPLGRQLALFLAVNRTALGIGVLFATRPALKAMQFGEPGPSGEALAKFGGGRDLALGLLTLAARDNREMLRTLVLAGVALDAADTFSLSLAAREPETRTAGIGGAAAGSAAALIGLLAWRRLG
jgi:Domain of unknown function (DUF4267)